MKGLFEGRRRVTRLSARLRTQAVRVYLKSSDLDHRTTGVIWTTYYVVRSNEVCTTVICITLRAAFVIGNEWVLRVVKR